MVSNDVVFDESSPSTVTHTSTRFTGGQLLQPKHLAPPAFPEPKEQTDQPNGLSNDIAPNLKFEENTPIDVFSHNPDVPEYFDLTCSELEEDKLTDT